MCARNAYGEFWFRDFAGLEGYLIHGWSVLTRGHDWAARAAQLCRLELHGRGGYFGAGGDSRATERMPWAAALGKGRRHATDGAAWDAAIEEVAARLEQAISLATDAVSERDRIRGLVDGWLGTEDAPWVMSLIRGRVVALATERPHDWAAAVREWDFLLRFVRSVDGLGAGGES